MTGEAGSATSMSAHSSPVASTHFRYPSAPSPLDSMAITVLARPGRPGFARRGYPLQQDQANSARVSSDFPDPARPIRATPSHSDPASR